jgi:hypothetical protein
MPALNFKPQFVPKIESGEKQHTIRALRQDGRDPKPGDTLYLYTGLRQKGARKLMEAPCVKVQDIQISWIGIVIDGDTLSPDERHLLAVRDGFTGWLNMLDFWRKRINQLHPVPWRGKIIHWRKP